MGLLRPQQCSTTDLTQGKVSTLELKKVAHDLGEDLTEAEAEDMFSRADLHDDGFVPGDDFYNIMTHKVYWEK